MIYDISLLDHNKYNYFVDDNNEMIKVDKNSYDTDFEFLKKKYFYHDGSKTFNILFGLDGDTSKKSFFKYLIINFGDTNISTKHQIINFFIELLQKCDVIELKGKVVIVYYQDLDFDFNSIVESINLDFFTSIKMYNSGKTYYYKPNYFSKIFNLIFKLEMFSDVNSKGLTNQTLTSIKESYNYFKDKKINPNSFLHCINNVNLVLHLVKSNYNEIKEIRPIILNNINDDIQSEKIIESMLKNNLNVSNTAKDLYMHRNTLNYKLDYIRSETGFNIQKFSDAMAMYWLINTK